jgi:hypothetical protein
MRYLTLLSAACALALGAPLPAVQAQSPGRDAARARIEALVRYLETLQPKP